MQSVVHRDIPRFHISSFWILAHCAVPGAPAPRRLSATNSSGKEQNKKRAAASGSSAKRLCSAARNKTRRAAGPRGRSTCRRPRLRLRLRPREQERHRMAHKAPLLARL
ncbi:Protein of unknown function [Gryllus bimaculatus]|nr:Protein of unknown function [Gryllus bimaculatus]